MQISITIIDRKIQYIVFCITFTSSNKQKMKRILVGGQALKNLGSDRYTNDTDYLVNDITTKEAFICSE